MTGTTSRRAILRGATGLGLLGLTAGCSQVSDLLNSAKSAGSSTPTASASASSSCGAVSTTSLGAYHLDYNKIRKDITDDRDGVPLQMWIAIVRSGACTAIQSAAVEVWHCDSDGLYSGYTDVAPEDNVESTGATTAGVEVGDDERYLRGIALTDKTGTAEFVSIYPGWVNGRAPHVHLRVRTGGTVSGTTYTGGKVIHTGQLYFPDDISTKVAALTSYSANTTKRTTRAADAEFKKTGAGATFTLKALKTGSVSAGYVAVAVLRVNEA